MKNCQDSPDNYDCNKYIIGEKCGTITVTVYKESNSKSPIFYIDSDTEDVLPISYIIEDTLALY